MNEDEDNMRGRVVTRKVQRKLLRTLLFLLMDYKADAQE